MQLRMCSDHIPSFKRLGQTMWNMLRNLCTNDDLVDFLVSRSNSMDP